MPRPGQYQYQQKNPDTPTLVKQPWVGNIIYISMADSIAREAHLISWFTPTEN